MWTTSYVLRNESLLRTVLEGRMEGTRALILYRRRRFINHLLTYLLTYKNSWETECYDDVLDKQLINDVEYEHKKKIALIEKT